MKGIIFNLLEDFLKERLGEERFEDLIEGCSLKTREPFVGPGSYPDEDLLAIVDRAVEATGRPKPETLRAFGRFCIGRLAQMTELLMDTTLTSEQREYASGVKISAESLRPVISDVLDFAKIEAQKLELTCRIAPEVPDDVTGDPGRLRQILINLIGNAVKFTERKRAEV